MEQVEGAVGMYEQLGDVVGEGRVVGVTLPGYCVQATNSMLLQKELCLSQSASFRRKLSSVSMSFLSSWQPQLFWLNRSPVGLCMDEGKSDNANAYIEQAKVHTASSEYNPGRTIRRQARMSQ